MNRSSKVLVLCCALAAATVFGGWCESPSIQAVEASPVVQAKVIRKKTADSTKTTTTKKSTKETDDLFEKVEDGKINKADQKMIDMMNKEREKQGLPALEADPELCKAAAQRAEESVTSETHKRPDGTSYTTLLDEKKIKYVYYAENSAEGQKTIEEAMKSWMNSEGHKANILNSKMSKVGVGKYKADDGTLYWVQMFIGF